MSVLGSLQQTTTDDQNQNKSPRIEELRRKECLADGNVQGLAKQPEGTVGERERSRAAAGGATATASQVQAGMQRHAWNCDSSLMRGLLRIKH